MAPLVHHRKWKFAWMPFTRFQQNCQELFPLRLQWPGNCHNGMISISPCYLWTQRCSTYWLASCYSLYSLLKWHYDITETHWKLPSDQWEFYSNIHTQVIISKTNRVIEKVSLSLAMKVRIIITLVLYFNCGTIVTLNKNNFVSDIADIIIRKEIHHSVTIVTWETMTFFLQRRNINIDGCLDELFHLRAHQLTMFCKEFTVNCHSSGFAHTLAILNM